MTYENILEKISKNELHKKVEDKLYSKIENFEIFKDVVENIYPKIIERDRNN